MAPTKIAVSSENFALRKCDNFIDNDRSEGKLDKNGKAKKFPRDLESDWTNKNDVPHYGLKDYTGRKDGLN